MTLSWRRDLSGEAPDMVLLFLDGVVDLPKRLGSEFEPNVLY